MIRMWNYQILETLFFSNWFIMAMDAGWYDVSTNMHPIISSMELIACLFQVIVTEKIKILN